MNIQSFLSFSNVFFFSVGIAKKILDKKCIDADSNFGNVVKIL
jgi:hypothetical protein